MNTTPDYAQLSSLASALEEELKSMRVWSLTSLPEEKFVNMGAFGINTMALVEWIQFVLIPILHDIIRDKRDLPEQSMIGVHAVREFDGAPEYSRLCELLIQLDNVTHEHTVKPNYISWYDHGQEIPGDVTIEESVIPDVLHDLAKLLPTFEGDFLEAQLQTFDALLPHLPALGRSQMIRLFNEAISETKIPSTKLRLRKAAAALTFKKPICKVQSHSEEMRKFQEEFKKGYPDSHQGDVS